MCHSTEYIFYHPQSETRYKNSPLRLEKGYILLQFDFGLVSAYCTPDYSRSSLGAKLHSFRRFLLSRRQGQDSYRKWPNRRSLPNNRLLYVVKIVLDAPLWTPPCLIDAGMRITPKYEEWAKRSKIIQFLASLTIRLCVFHFVQSQVQTNYKDRVTMTPQ